VGRATPPALIFVSALMKCLPASAIILAGGKSRRMGSDKRFLEVQGKTMLDRTISFCEKLFSEIIIVTAGPESLIKSVHKVVYDIIPNSAALGGIYTGLLTSKELYGFVVACDMPWLHAELIKFLVQRPGESSKSNYDVVVPKSSYGFQPTHALYSKRCLPILEGMISEKNFEIKNIFNRKEIFLRAVLPDEIALFDQSGRAFMNINTPEDFKGILRDENSTYDSA